MRCDVSTDSGRNERDGPPRTRWTPTTTTRNQKVPPPDVQRPDRPIDQSLRHRVGISHWLAGSTRRPPGRRAYLARLAVFNVRSTTTGWAVATA